MVPRPTSPSSARPPRACRAVESDPSRLRQLLVVLLVDALRGLGERPRGGPVRIDATAPDGAGRGRRWRWPIAGAEGAARAGDAALLPSGRSADGGVGGTLRVERDDAGGRLRPRPADRRAAAGERRPGRPAASTHRAATARDRPRVRRRGLDPRAPRPDPRAGRDAGRRRSRRPAALAIIEATDVDAVLTDQHMAGHERHRAVRGAPSRPARARRPVRRHERRARVRRTSSGSRTRPA